jgi:hypothetical protein
MQTAQEGELLYHVVLPRQTEPSHGETEVAPTNSGEVARLTRSTGMSSYIYRTKLEMPER